MTLKYNEDKVRKEMRGKTYSEFFNTWDQVRKGLKSYYFNIDEVRYLFRNCSRSITDILESEIKKFKELQFYLKDEDFEL